jgi:hypothetical protein
LICDFIIIANALFNERLRQKLGRFHLAAIEDQRVHIRPKSTLATSLEMIQRVYSTRTQSLEFKFSFASDHGISCRKCTEVPM